MFIQPPLFMSVLVSVTLKSSSLVMTPDFGELPTFSPSRDCERAKVGNCSAVVMLFAADAVCLATLS